MDVDVEIKHLSLKILQTQQQIRWLRKHRKALEPLPNCCLSGGQLDFDQLDHAQAIRVIRAIGGKWHKKANCTNKASVDYEQTAPSESGFNQFRLWQAAPPASCKIVEIEEEIPERVIPAQKVKVRKMVCPGAPPLVLAIAKVTAEVQATETPSPASAPPQDDVPF